jgi:hypothetical protein
VLLESRGSRSRCLVVWTATTLGLGWAGTVIRPLLRPVALDLPSVARTPLDVALTELAAVTLLGCALWLWVVTTVVVAEALRGADPSGLAARGVPVGVRRLVLAACGVALAGGLAQPAGAADPQVRSSHRARLEALTGLPLPDRAVAPTESAAPTVAARTVRVQPGDSLWSLAAGDLPPGSPDALVATRWRSIYAANRALIGPDPDVIVPGQRLRLPGKDPT